MSTSCSSNVASNNLDQITRVQIKSCVFYMSLSCKLLRRVERSWDCLEMYIFVAAIHRGAGTTGAAEAAAPAFLNNKMKNLLLLL